MLAVKCKPQANKSFLIQQFFKNVGEVWASSPHLRSKLILQSAFPLQLHFLKPANSELATPCEVSCKFRQGNGAIAACWQAKAGVEPPFAGWERPFYLRKLLLGKPIAYGSAESLRCLPVCCSPVVALSELLMNVS